MNLRAAAVLYLLLFFCFPAAIFASVAADDSGMLPPAAVNSMIQENAADDGASQTALDPDAPPDQNFKSLPKEKQEAFLAKLAAVGSSNPSPETRQQLAQTYALLGQHAFAAQNFLQMGDISRAREQALATPKDDPNYPVADSVLHLSENKLGSTSLNAPALSLDSSKASSSDGFGKVKPFPDSFKQNTPIAIPGAQSGKSPLPISEQAQTSPFALPSSQIRAPDHLTDLPEPKLPSASVKNVQAPGPDLREQAAESLKQSGKYWLSTAGKEGENGLAGFKKFGEENIGGALTAGGIILEKAPEAASNTAKFTGRLITFDPAAYKEAAIGAGHFAKNTVTGMVDTVKTTAVDWKSAVTDRPTTYQALNATKGTLLCACLLNPTEGAAEGLAENTAAEGLAENTAAKTLGESSAAIGLQKTAAAETLAGKGTLKGVESEGTQIAKLPSEKPGAISEGKNQGSLNFTPKNQEEIKSLLYPDGKLIGEAGTDNKIRLVKGSSRDAETLFNQLTTGGREVTSSKYPGTLKELPNGDLIGYRPISATGPPTIDINSKDFQKIKKVKFIE